MSIKEVTYTNFDGIEVTYIEITNPDGSMTTFAKDLDNPAYQAYLKSLEDSEQDYAETLQSRDSIKKSSG